MIPAGRRLPVVLAAAIVLALAPVAPATEPPALSVQQIRGNVGLGVIATFAIRAPLAQVYAILAEPSSGAEYLPFVTKVVMEKVAGRDQTVRYHARHLGLFNVQYVLHRHLEPPDAVSFHQEAGLFRRTEGFWRLRATDTGTRVTYQVQVDPGFWVPGAIQALMLKQGLPAMTDAIRQRAESGGTWRKP